MGGAQQFGPPAEAVAVFVEGAWYPELFQGERDGLHVSRLVAAWVAET